MMNISLAISGLLNTESVSSLSNEQLMLRYVKKQESQILGLLYDNCSKDLLYFLLTLTEPSLAAEISQITWLRVIEKRHLYKQSGSFKSWLFTLGRRCLIDEFRRLNRFKELYDDQPQEERASDNDVHLVTGEESAYNDIFCTAVEQDFNDALIQLPFLQKEAFCLQQEGFSLAEISHMTSADLETTKSRIRYAKKMIRKRLEKHHG